jgi:hypothetical protein
MLERPRKSEMRRHSTVSPRSAAATARQRTFRRRLRLGLMPITVECDCSIVDLLIRLKWLEELDSADKAAIGHAIARMLADTAEKYLRCP